MVKSQHRAQLSPDKDDKRALILRSATALFSRDGWRRTSVDDVAREAGIAKGTVYLYFASKEELFRAVAGEVIAKILGDARKGAAKETLHAQVEAVLRAKFLYLYELVDSSPHAAELFESKDRLCKELFLEADGEFMSILAAVLEGGRRAGSIDLERAHLRSSELAEFLFRCAHGLGTPDASGNVPSVRAYAGRLREMVRILLLQVIRDAGSATSAESRGRRS